MANRNNSGRTKKSHSFRPYDTSNSFVKRITAKVSEILPQPTSWVSRWFSPASKLNTRGREDLDEEDEDEEERQPPSKRLCFGPPDTSDFSHQNNVNRLSDLARESGEISPILSSRAEEDRAIPGPSGLHLRHFVSSTPAVRQATPPPKVNLREKARDDASDESETTSGCSSLVPGADRPHTRQEQLSTQATPTPKITNTSSIRRLSTNTLNSTALLNRSNSMNLSTSSQPSFDTYVFNNPLNRSGIRRKSVADDSCFYPGHTTFGGSSSRLTAPVDQPRVVSVKPSPSKQLQQDTIGTSALRILRALEQFSTPVLDAKRIPMRKDAASIERKRKAPQPYEELIYPSMPDLLRIKKRQQQQESSRLQPEQETSTSKAASSSTSVKTNSNPSSSTRAPPTSSTDAVYTHSSAVPSKEQYTFRKENPKERHAGSLKGRIDEDEFERVPPVNLPDVKLQLSSLPKFDINVPALEKKAPASQPNPTPSSNKSNPPPFKFSDPEEANINSTNDEKLCLPVNTFKFSEPLEPLEFSKKQSETTNSPKMNENLSSKLQMKNPSPNFMLKRKTSETSESHSNFKFEVKPSSGMKNASVMDVLSKKPFESNSISAMDNWTCNSCKTKNNVVLSNCKTCGKVKTLSNDNCSASSVTWDCKKCSLKNTASETKCKSCGLEKNETPKLLAFKGFEGFKKPTDTWECKSCLVTNKNSSDSCVACSEPKSGKQSTSTNSGNKNLFESTLSKPNETKVNDVGSKSATFSTLCNSVKIPLGSWECSTCLIKNKKEDNKCAACSTEKPGSASSEKMKPMFSFGIPSTNANETKTVNAIAKTESASNQPHFTFGMPQENTNAVSTSNINTVEEPKKEIATCADSSSTVSSTINSSVSTPLVNSIKKPEGSWECGTCLVQNKKDSSSCVACNTAKPGSAPVEKPLPTFSFGIPQTTSNSTPFVTSTTSEKNNNSNLAKPQFTFGNPSDDKKTTSSMFSFTSNESKASNDFKPFSFMNAEQPKEKEETKPPVSNLFTFGNANKETKNEEMNDETDEKPAKKKVSFGSSMASFDKQVANDTSTVSFGSLVPNKTNEISSSSNFSFTPKLSSFENNASVKKDVAPTSNALFSFGSTSEVTKPTDLVSASEPTKPASFGVASSEKTSAPSELPNSNSIFGNTPLSGFKAPDSGTKPFSFMPNTQPTNQQSGGFTFNPPATPAAAEFGSQSNQLVPTSTPSLFGQQHIAPSPTPLFAQPQEQKPFVFNAPVQQQQGPVFTFTATPTPAQAGGLGSTSFGGFAPPPTPKFDPNIKPSFNFTGGATPSFSASSNSLDMGGENKRKVRKAIRRTTQQR